MVEAHLTIKREPKKCRDCPVFFVPMSNNQCRCEACRCLPELKLKYSREWCAKNREHIRKCQRERSASLTDEEREQVRKQKREWARKSRANIKKPKKCRDCPEFYTPTSNNQCRCEACQSVWNSKRNKVWYANLTDEERKQYRERHHKWYVNLTDEEREECRKRERERRREWRANLTDEEREREREREREYHREWRANLTDEERERERERGREYYAEWYENLTDEEREDLLKMQQELRANRRFNDQFVELAMTLADLMEKDDVNQIESPIARC